jgi:hypothetical protein
VRLLPTSPRKRRRLLYAGAVVLALAAVVAVGFALPNYDGPGHGILSKAPARVVRQPRSVPLRARDRAAIDATLDRFLPDALRRENLGAAYELATPAFRAGSTRRDWERGSSPVMPYPARGRTFHSWRLNYSYADDVSLDLLVHPTSGDIGPIAFDIELRRRRGRWLVDSFFPRAVFPSEIATRKEEDQRPLSSPDFKPLVVQQQAARADSNKGRLSAAWFVVPAAVVALIALVPGGLAVVSWRRDRRLEREYRAGRL